MYEVHSRLAGYAFATLLLAPGIAPPAAAGGVVLSEQKVSQAEGGFTGILSDGDALGHSMAALGDLDGDGTVDLAVGAPWADAGGSSRGAVWILFLRPDGTVKAQQEISDGEGGFGGALSDADLFGFSVAGLGDLDGDGVADLAVGAPGDDDGGPARGAVWVLFLDGDGSVRTEAKISDLAGGFAGDLEDSDSLGTSLSTLGDLDGDGFVELAVGATGDDGDGSDRGAVHLLSLSPAGSVVDQQQISAASGGFDGTLDDGDRFGAALAALGDLDGDGTADLAVGASFDDDGFQNAGALWVLFLDPGGDVVGHRKVSATTGGFAGSLKMGDGFGAALTRVGDADCDGVGDLAVGAPFDDTGGALGADRGAFWILRLRSDGLVAGHQKVSDLAGGFSGGLDDADFLGTALASLGDLDGDGRLDLAVGAPGDDDGGAGRGALWNLGLDAGCLPVEIFRDGFESEDTSEWSDTVAG